MHASSNNGLGYNYYERGKKANARIQQQWFRLQLLWAGQKGKWAHVPTVPALALVKITMSRARKAKVHKAATLFWLKFYFRSWAKGKCTHVKHWFWSHFVSPDDLLLHLFHLGKSWENKNVLLISAWLFIVHKHRIGCCHVVWNNINIILHFINDTTKKYLVLHLHLNWIEKHDYLRRARGGGKGSAHLSPFPLQAWTNKNYSFMGFFRWLIFCEYQASQNTLYLCKVFGRIREETLIQLQKNLMWGQFFVRASAWL